MLSTFAWFFLSFNGRISRQEYWLGMFATIAIELLVVHVLQNAGSSTGPFYFTSGAATSAYEKQLYLTAGMSKLVAAGILLWPCGALLLKRMHDIGLSAKWLLAMPGIIFVATLTDLAVLNTVAAVGATLVLAFVPGIRGANEFGADPLARPGQQL
jgi:uncharacterized membrane protein YhaH (DUF805 family)